jgi:lysophospholipase L1-like esterase
MKPNPNIRRFSNILFWPVFTVAMAAFVTLIAGVARGDGADTVDPAAFDHPVRVACMGDSITQGPKDPKTEGYPAQLQNILGAKWEVKNFGVGGRTLLRKQDPYDIRPALKWNPDVIIIMLGTNDSRQTTWDKHGSDFLSDYKTIIESCKAIASHPRIFICCPVPAVPPGNYKISDEILTGKVIPLIHQAAEEEKTSLIDLHTAMSEHKDEFPDKIHPNAAGARHIAEAVAHIIAKI